MKRLVLPLLFCVAAQANAQVNNFKIQAGINHTWIKENRENPELTGPQIPMASGGSYYTTNPGILVEEFESKPGFHVGTTFAIFQTKIFFIETGVSAQYFNYKKSTLVEGLPAQTKFPTLDGRVTSIVGNPFPYLSTSSYNPSSNGQVIIGTNGQPIIDGVEVPEFPKPSSDLGITKTLYVQIPVMIGKALLKDKLIVKTGISTDVLVYASVYKYKNDWGVAQELIKDTSKDEFNNVLLTGRLQATYVFYKHIGIDLSYQYSFSSTYKNNEIGKSNYNNLSVGVSYNFVATKLEP